MKVTASPFANIASQLKLPQNKVQTYVDNTFITFSGKEGKKC